MLVAIVDTETTGLGPSDQPISIGLLLLEVIPPKGDLVREVTRYYGLREPTVPINPGAARVHGLTMDQLRGKQFETGIIREILGAADVLVAHYAEFDARMLRAVGLADRRPWLCSVRQLAWPTSNQKLDTICEQFGIARPSPHNALDDCLALSAALFQRTGKTDRSRTYMGAMLAQNNHFPYAEATPAEPPPPPSDAEKIRWSASPWEPTPPLSDAGEIRWSTPPWQPQPPPQKDESWVSWLAVRVLLVLILVGLFVTVATSIFDVRS